MTILINHIGYEPADGTPGTAAAVLQGAEGETLPDYPEFEVVAPGPGGPDAGEILFRGTGGKVLSVEGWKNRSFVVLDFSELRREGRVFLRVRAAGRTLESPPFTMARGLLVDSCVSDLLFYFKSQRSSGIWDRADRQAPFFGERTGRADVHGGWFDASGDYSKYLSHLSYAHYMNPQQTPLVVWALLSAEEALGGSAEYKGTLLRVRAREEALWGADFLMRMQDPEGFFYTTVFDQWNKKPENRMICSYKTQQGIRLESYQASFRAGGGVSLAALARAAAAEPLAWPENPRGEYAPEEYLAAAERGWAHLAEKNPGYTSDGRENIIDHYCALLAAAELFRATRKEPYLEAARERAASLEACFSREGRTWLVHPEGQRPFFHAAEAGFPAVALCRYLETEPEASRREGVLDLVRAAMAAELEVTGEVANPFRLARQTVQGAGESRRTSFFIPHSNESGYWWQGENARLASLACAAGMAARALEENRPGDELIPLLHRYGRSQLDWILGKNPFDMCMLQGRGRNNPRYEDHYPNAPGGICNGITGGFEDEADVDFLPYPAASRGDQRWRWSEQWIPHGAWFLLALGADPGI